MSSDRPAFPGGGRYHRLGPALRARFGERVQKVTLRGGFGCPNRDGRVGVGGCVFCSTQALLPASGDAFGPVTQQFEAGFAAATRRTRARKAIAYFQDQTATDAPLPVLRDLYTNALSDPRVVALAVGTRPDWLPAQVLELLSELAARKPVMVELGLQTANDEILRAINRNHSVADFESAVERCHAHNLEVVAHVIIDLPDESQDDREQTAACLNRTAVEGVKIHNLHVLKDTPLAGQYDKGMLHLAPLPEYADMVAGFLQELRPAVVIHRLTGEGPAELMLAPAWGRDKQRILRCIEQRLEELDAWQGKKHEDAKRQSRIG